jgi:hypothetical protein
VQWVGEDTFGVSFQNVRPAELEVRAAHRRIRRGRRQRPRITG